MTLFEVWVAKGEIMKLFRIPLYLAAMFGVWSASTTEAQCVYQIDGQVGIRTNDLFTGNLTNVTEDLPLERIVVQVQYRRGLWWGNAVEVRTDANGQFSITDDKSCRNRRVRVRVKLDSPEIESRPGTTLSSKWYTLFETPGRTNDRVFNLGTSLFEEFNGAGALQNVIVYRRALIYWVGRQLVDFLAAQPNPYLAFEQKVHVSYPHAGGSFAAAGIQHTTYVAENQWEPSTIVHELMHLWNYQHNFGTTNWAPAINGTHNCQEPRNIAFHEGFAEFAGQHLQFMMWGFRYDEWDLWTQFDPSRMGRPADIQCDDGLPGPEIVWTPATPNEVQGSDRYTEHALTLLTRDPNETCLPRALDVLDLMSVFEAAPASGWPTEWQVGDNTFGVERFYDRVGDIMFGNRDYTDFRWAQNVPGANETLCMPLPPCTGLSCN